jgi:hypothetical protein
VALHLAVRAHARFVTELRRHAKTGRRDAAKRFERELLLERAARQHEQAQIVRERVLKRGGQHRRRLAEAGGRFE